MGNRYMRKFTRKDKEAIVKEYEAEHAVGGNGGDVFCGPRERAIDRSTCIVSQARNARQCYGCGEYRP